jgi:Methyltransferase domain
MDQAVVPTPHITQMETRPQPALAAVVRNAFEDTLADRSSMDARIYDVHGFCGRKQRLLFNNLVRTIEDPRYLEIGIFHGATLCAAISNNKVKVTGIDNWSEYGGQPNAFYTNLLANRGPDTTVSVLEQDFRTVDYAHIGKFNVLFYDGPHAEKDQYDGVAMALPALDGQAVLLVDDWNWDHVRRATMSALRDAGVRMEFSFEVRTSFDNAIPSFAFGNSDWHNGMFAAVISK